MTPQNSINKIPLYCSFNSSKGFTIIELVVVIILMGILSVTVAPKFFNSNGFEEYAYQAEVVTVLRNAQLKAMQQTANVDETGNDICHRVLISSNTLSITSLCSDASDEQKINEANRYIPEVFITGDAVTFETTGGVSSEFSFDSLGRPINCSAPCEVIVIGEELLTVRIESEGFIHAL